MRWSGIKEATYDYMRTYSCTKLCLEYLVALLYAIVLFVIHSYRNYSSPLNRFLLPLSSCTATSLSAMARGSLSSPVSILDGTLTAMQSSLLYSSWSDLDLNEDDVAPAATTIRGNVTLQTALASPPLLHIPCPAAGALSTCPVPLSGIPISSSSTSTQPSWSIGGWSACSKSCGGGSRTRAASCAMRDPKGSPLRVVPALACSSLYGPVPANVLTQPCNSQTCSPVAWIVSRFFNLDTFKPPKHAAEK